MIFIKISVFTLIISLSLHANSQKVSLKVTNEIESKFKLENDTSLSILLERWAAVAGYEFSFSGTQDLPIISDLQNIESVLFHTAIERALGAYKSRNLNLGMEARIDDEKKQLYVTTSKVVTRTESSKSSVPDVFIVSENDKSMMQVIVRWATQIGYQSYINGDPVNLQVFPRHVSRYPDYSLINLTKAFKSRSNLKESINQFISLYTGISLDPFTLTVDDEKKRLYIVSLIRY